MPPERPTPGTPEHWLARARGHLALARQAKPPEACWEDMAFHAQQAAEMAIKAVYQKKRAVFEFTHDLNQLLKGLRAGGMHVPHELEAADLLTKYATKARYPGLIPHVTEVEFRSALVIAGEVIQWAEGAGQTGPDS